MEGAYRVSGIDRRDGEAYFGQTSDFAGLAFDEVILLRSRPWLNPASRPSAPFEGRVGSF